MKRGKVLQTAIDEAERFLKRAKAYKPGGYPNNDTNGRASAKRASLDATKALAVLRKACASDWNEDTK